MASIVGDLSGLYLWFELMMANKKLNLRHVSHVLLVLINNPLHGVL